MNLRPSGYEPDELPDCSTPRQYKFNAYLYVVIDIINERTFFFQMDGGGFEPPKALLTDLQSAPFGHSGTHPYVGTHVPTIWYSIITLTKMQVFFTIHNSSRQSQNIHPYSTQLHHHESSIPHTLSYILAHTYK